METQDETTTLCFKNSKWSIEVEISAKGREVLEDEAKKVGWDLFFGDLSTKARSWHLI